MTPASGDSTPLHDGTNVATAATDGAPLWSYATWPHSGLFAWKNGAELWQCDDDCAHPSHEAER